ncbi:MAG: HD-GYP domain-containing protein, partial [Spirochaetales bacterium]|nr:HD-GYP domain-containing protein [Spirochaetales bacterium]
MKDYPVDGIAPETYFSRPVYLDPGFIIAAPEMPINSAIKTALGEWGFKTLQSDGEPGAEYFFEEKPGPETPVIVFKDAADMERLQRAETVYLQFQYYVSFVFAEILANTAPAFSEMAEKV